jgi:YesN/AraC family two-component response regulator
MPPLRVVLADDQVLFREGLRALLATQASIEVVGEAENGEEVLRIVMEQHPDVVLMDVRMPIMDSVAATPLLRTITRWLFRYPSEERILTIAAGCV